MNQDNSSTLSQPSTLQFTACADAQGGHRMAWWQWGDAQAAHVIVCAHGLTRQGRDFDVLAQTLVERAPHPVRVICPDVVGRGRSDWLKDAAGYQVPVYAGDMLAMLTQLHQIAPIAQLDWVGTSMGGLIGIVLFGAPDLPLPAPLRKLVLNDVGPVIQWSALQRIGQYLGKAGRFETEQQAADAMWAISSSFGSHTPEQWLALSRPMLKKLPDGGWTLHYDPAIAKAFTSITQEQSAQAEVAMWSLYDRITAPTLLVRGEQSDLLSLETAKQMGQRGPKAKLVEFAGVGHAPTLIATDQQQAITSFLLG